MNTVLLDGLLDRALARQITFPEILAALSQEGIESYHVDFRRNECRYYGGRGDSYVATVEFGHDGVAADFFPEKLEAANRRVRVGEAGYADFVREAAAAGCAGYAVYLRGKLARYWGRDGGEHVEHFPGQPASRPDPGGAMSGGGPGSGAGVPPAARGAGFSLCAGPRGPKEAAMDKMARSAIRHADIRATPEKVYAFLSSPMNWPEYAVVNLRSVSPGRDGWFRATTRFGQGEIRVDGVKEFGILDHVWRDPQASWKVYARVVPNGDGATVMFTLFQPPVMSDAQFDQAMEEMGVEMAKLKDVLER